MFQDPEKKSPVKDRAPASPLCLTLGVAMTLALAGYQFGESNHAVYLVDALRQNDPRLLANDWWTQSTLQYHFVFTRLSAWLMRINLIEPAFLAGYVTLAVLMHVAWRRLTLTLGGDDTTYIVSVILYHLMAAGTGLGVYHFLQNSAFLPSNVANVAMLWGLYLWIRGRSGWAGLAFGIAGLFHLNHALAGIGLWFGLTVVEITRGGPSPASPVREVGAVRIDRAWGIGTGLLLALSLPAIGPAAKSVLNKTASLPLQDFVDLYARLRHPHHYDPSSWPAGLWLTFLLPLAVAAPAYRLATRERSTPPLRRASTAFGLFCVMLAVALFGAGIWYVSEPLVQMSLYRFSIYPKLLSCVATAWLLWRHRYGRFVFRMMVVSLLLGVTGLIVVELLSGRVRGDTPAFLAANVFPLWLFALFAMIGVVRQRVLGSARLLLGTVVSVCVVISLIQSWPKLGIVHEGFRGDDRAYLSVCEWARQNTPDDAVFLVPPDEQSFRLLARRAIVVNFKNVPQLSGELVEWRNRLQAVLGVDDLRQLPTPFYRTLDAIRLHYAGRSTASLAAVATRYGARYVVSVHPLDPTQVGKPVFSDAEGRYFLYDLANRRDVSGVSFNGS